jgi:hypothetical protein
MTGRHQAIRLSHLGTLRGPECVSGLNRKSCSGGVASLLAMAKPVKSPSTGEDPSSDTQLEATADLVAQAAAGKDAPDAAAEESSESETPTIVVTEKATKSLLTDEPDDADVPAPSTKDRLAASASKGADQAAKAASKGAEQASKAASQAKATGARAGGRFKSAAAGAGKRASDAADAARERAAGADVGQFATNTTSLIDTARPFFLAGFAVAFAILGFLASDSATGQLFVFGAILFVVGAAFSGEIDAFVAHFVKKDDADDQPS